MVEIVIIGWIEQLISVKHEELMERLGKYHPSKEIFL